MNKVIPRTIKYIENYHNSLYKSSILARLQRMTHGHLSVEIEGDEHKYSFGLGQKIRADLYIKSEQFFLRLLRYGEVGFGESYVEGDWESKDLVSLIKWFIINIHNSGSKDPPLFLILDGLHKVKRFMNQSSYSSFDKNISYHYDLGKFFFAQFLDETLTNSSGMFSGQDLNLESAQIVKNRKISEQLMLDSGTTVLDLGCGWGSLSFYIALSFGCPVTCVTVSEEQYRYIRERIEELHLNKLITPMLCDYRDVKGSFDRIVSVELIDSLVRSDLHNFWGMCDYLLKPKGRMVHQLLLQPETKQFSSTQGDWVQKYITPGALTPTMTELCMAIRSASSFQIEHLNNLGQDYAKTYELWLSRFTDKIDFLRRQGYDENFLRTWQYYLAYAQAAHSLEALTCTQITLKRAKDQLL